MHLLNVSAKVVLEKQQSTSYHKTLQSNGLECEIMVAVDGVLAKKTKIDHDDRKIFTQMLLL